MDSIHEVSIPVGSLSIIGMKGCEEMAAKVDNYISSCGGERHGELMKDGDFIGYCRDTYLLKASCPRFGDGEAKGTLKEDRPRSRRFYPGRLL